uniref:Uncharacterized protein n=1 Tax=Arcella intermedia TaxID=1963864 RepID=A0A6B2LK82_9EUKA
MVKLIIIGDSGVGKTTLQNQWVLRRETEVKCNIGYDFLSKDILIKDIPATIQIWDTAGQERFESLGVSYFRGVDCCLLVYDVTKEISFDHLEKWKDLCQQQETRFPLVVVGNKIDLQKECKFEEKVEKWCESNGFSHFETSAKSKIGVDEMFFKALQEVQISLDDQSDPISLNQDTSSSYFSYCC